MSKQASELFSTNMYNLLEELMQIPTNSSNNAANFKINPEDDIQRGLLVFNGGEYIQNAPIVQQPLKKEEAKETRKEESKPPVAIELSVHKAGKEGDYVALREPEEVQPSCWKYCSPYLFFLLIFFHAIL